MKIGIFCTGRCGSTSLYHGLINSFLDKEKYRAYFEPNFGGPRNEEELKMNLPLYNIDVDFSYPYILTKDLVNIIPGMIPYRYSLNFKVLVEDISDFYINYSKNFDVVILLMRQNELAVAQSWEAHKNFSHWDPWTFDTKDMDAVYPIKRLDQVRNVNTILYYIAKSLKKEIIYYEDLFSGNKDYISNFIQKYNLPIENFELFYSYLNPNAKYNLRKYV